MRTLEHQPCQHAAVHNASLGCERMALLVHGASYSGTVDKPIHCQGCCMMSTLRSHLDATFLCRIATLNDGLHKHLQSSQLGVAIMVSTSRFERG
jgi:hypothetical protein